MAEETMSNDQQNEMLFMQLVMMFQGMAMQQLGKVMNPMTQQVERDLGQAKNFIDLLSMIEAKTGGNLSENEQKLLQQALFDLRMNYVDEIKQGDTSEGEEPTSEDDEAATDGPAESAGTETDPKEDA